MALDYLAFSRLISLIKDKIVGGKIVKIVLVSAEEFIFTIRKDNYNHNLLVSTHPNMSYINFVNQKIESTHQSTNLLILLRKNLENGQVTSFANINNDRVIKMVVRNKDEYYKIVDFNLYIELIGRASNLILCDSSDKIIDSLKKIPLEYTNLRTIQANAKYTLPPIPENMTLPFAIENEIKHLNISYDELVKRINNSETIYITHYNNKKDFHFIPFTHLSNEIEKFDFIEGLNHFYIDALSEERHRQRISDLLKFVKNEIKKSEKKISKLKCEINNAKETNLYKDYGDILMTYYQGAKIYDNLIKHHDEYTGQIIEIPYNPLYDLYANAQLYYKKYRKGKTALIKIQEQIELCQENIDYFLTVLLSLDNANDYETIEQIKEELSLQGYMKSQKHSIKANKKPNKPKVYRPLKYQYKDYVIYVGQNNLQNEYLTFKIADKSNYFFHIKDAPGSHVVLVCDKLNEDNIRVAANVAALNSSFKNSGTVPVNYTQIKNIKKIPGGKPGKVIISNYKTIYIDPDNSVYEKLTRK